MLTGSKLNYRFKVLLKATEINDLSQFVKFGLDFQNLNLCLKNPDIKIVPNKSRYSIEPVFEYFKTTLELETFVSRLMLDLYLLLILEIFISTNKTSDNREFDSA